MINVDDSPLIVVKMIVIKLDLRCVNDDDHDRMKRCDVDQEIVTKKFFEKWEMAFGNIIIIISSQTGNE